ncbi:MAG: uracil-DNA glycosylase [Gammaproteobacteria bacterium]|nr:uracil-DNA glycosylase [Gammaproteobacteria bacterium]MCI0590619.1 uracil-DNA glycosylase [Gammaproteobacteria bacterium]
MTTRQRQPQFLRAMGIDVWVRRKHRVRDKASETSVASRASVAPEFSAAASAAVAQMDWETLRATVATCVRCSLHKTRTQTVFGVGALTADWLLVGEAPGVDEDRKGEPFVGRAGQLLNNMLFAMGLKREDVYIANILKCWPPKNRDPRPEEVISCEPYLKRQIQLIQPKIILALGRVAAHNLLKVDMPVGRMRGIRYEYLGFGIPVVVTYHPAYLLRSPREKLKAWQDLQFAKSVLESVA